ncbi:MAG: polysaccharide deacetylase family protein [Ferruginibacter sp.]
MFNFIRHYLHKIPSGRFYTYFSSKINRTNIGMIVSLHSITRGNAVKNSSFNQFIELSDTNLEKNIIALKKLGVQFVRLSELEAVFTENKKFRKPVVHLSFDDGYRDNYELAFPILKKHNIPFSIFVVSDFMNNPAPFLWWYIADQLVTAKKNLSFDKYDFHISAETYRQQQQAGVFARLRDFLLEHIDEDRAYFETILRNAVGSNDNIPATLSWDQLNEMIASGLCEAGIHTKTHARFKKFSRQQMEYEIITCRDVIYQHTGIKPDWFAYSYGGIRDLADKEDIKAVMQHCDIRLALCTVSGELNEQSNPYLLPRVFLNDASTTYTLKTRLNGSYQRSRPSI